MFGLYVGGSRKPLTIRDNVIRFVFEEKVLWQHCGEWGGGGASLEKQVGGLRAR